MLGLICVLVLLFAPVFTFAEEEHPILPIGSPAPDFTLPGVDVKTALVRSEIFNRFCFARVAISPSATPRRL
jgi:hypothetical protein